MGRNSEGVIKAWYYYPLFTCFQAGWTFSFATEIMWLQLICMAGILVSLVSASMSLQTYKKSWKGYLIWQFPFSIQTGWIMAASCLSINVLPVYYEAAATTRIVVASLCLAGLIVTAFTWLSSYPVDFAIPCVILWALCGVYMELSDPMPAIPEFFSTKQINGVQYAVITGIALIATGIVAKALYVLEATPRSNESCFCGSEKGSFFRFRIRGSSFRRRKCLNFGTFHFCRFFYSCEKQMENKLMYFFCKQHPERSKVYMG